MLIDELLKKYLDTQNNKVPNRSRINMNQVMLVIPFFDFKVRNLK